MGDIKNKDFRDILPDFFALENEIYCWGETVNKFTGSYAFNIIAGVEYTNRFGVARRGMWPFEVDLGGLKLFSPGTIFHESKIKSFVHEHAQKRNIVIEDPQSLKIKMLSQYFDMNYDIEYVDYSPKSRMNDLPAFIIPNYSNYDYLIIPCSVVADYYYYGMPKMIDYLLKGQFKKNRSENKIYDPEKSQYVFLADGRRVAYVRLEKEMYSIDAVKIARLAHDPFFWDAAMEMVGGLVHQTEPTYLTTRFPIKQSTTLSFYGRDLILHERKVCLALSIASCTARLPFDALIVSRDNPGASVLGQLGFDSDGKEPDDPNGKLPPKQYSLYVGPSKSPGLDKVGKGKAGRNSLDVNERYFRDQQDNFDCWNVVPEEAFVSGSGSPSKRFDGFLLNFGEVLEFLTFSLGRSGKARRRRLILTGSGPIEGEDVKQVSCFEMTEAALAALAIPGSAYNIEPIKPYPAGKDSYSRLPVEFFQANDSETKSSLKFCYINPRKKKLRIFKRVLVKEIQVDGLFFYVMDIQPNETEGNNDKVLISSKKRAIIFCNIERSKIENFKEILIETVKGRAKWFKVMLHLPFLDSERITHTNYQSMSSRFSKFIKDRINFTPAQP